MVNNYRIKALSDHLICSLEGKSFLKRLLSKLLKTMYTFGLNLFFSFVFSLYGQCVVEEHS